LALLFDFSIELPLSARLNSTVTFVLLISTPLVDWWQKFYSALLDIIITLNQKRVKPKNFEHKKTR
jgi:hypothetical protein